MSNPLDPHYEDITTLFDSCFSIPVFQRPYSWGKEEIDELFSDINEYYKNTAQDNLFMGTIYLAEHTNLKSSIKDYSVIDGQQRITTLALICLALYHYSKKLELDKEDTVIILKSLLWKKTEGRQLDKNAPLLTSSTIEQKAMKLIFDATFSETDKDELSKTIENYIPENKQEEIVIKNFQLINKNIEKFIISSTVNRNEELLNYIDFIITKIKIITIIVEKNQEKKLFEIFESINSKGKQLEQIDLIKSYIFQNIDNENYEEYLNIWGKLIKETDDRLEDYMYIFIKSYIRFYRVGLSAKYFKSLNAELMNHYNKDNLSDAFKEFLKDMQDKVKYYRNMSDKNSFLIDNNRFKFYTSCLRLLEYEHPSPIIFRAYCEYESRDDLSKKELTDVIRACFIYMFTFQTISNRDSKDAIKAFETIMTGIIENGFEAEKIVSSFKNALSLEGIGEEYIESNILNFTGFTEKKEKEASRILLAAYEFSENGVVDYDKAIYVMDNKESIQIDHILPRTPEKDDENCSYYKEGEKDKEVLRLKDYHDFNIPGIEDGISYALFQTQVLDKIGNLRLMIRSENIGKSNSIVELKDYSTFNTYRKISERAEDISKKLKSNEIFNI